MEMVLNNGFCEMSQDEIMLLEGGGVWRHIGYAGATVCCIIAWGAIGGGGAGAAGAAGGWFWYDATR